MVSWSGGVGGCTEWFECIELGAEILEGGGCRGGLSGGGLRFLEVGGVLVGGGPGGLR